MSTAMTTSKARFFGLIFFLSGLWDVASVVFKQIVSFGAGLLIVWGVLSIVGGLIILGQSDHKG